MSRGKKVGEGDQKVQEVEQWVQDVWNEEGERVFLVWLSVWVYSW